MTTHEVIVAYFDRINNGEWERWLELFTDDVIVDEALSGHSEGLEPMRASAAGIQQGFQRFTNTIDEIVVEGDKAMVVCTIDATTAGGNPLRSTGANFYRLRAGKIAYMASFHDREPFLKAFGAA